MENRENFFESTRRRVTMSLLAAGLLVASSCVAPPRTEAAPDNDFSDGITVSVTGDLPDANIADSICADSNGDCTLRAAIEEANDTVGANTIEFNIPGAGVRTIQPTSPLPEILDQVTIDGYSQPGSQPNTSIAPSPLNGTLLIEIDGSLAGDGTDALRFGGNSGGSSNSVVSGLVINRFGGNGQGQAINVGAENIAIRGNYLGTDASGSIDLGNTGAGVNHYNTNNSGAIIGGLNPADRNLISGNEDNAGYPKDNWDIKGNFVGVNATGDSAIPNSTPSGSGAFSIDVCDGVVVGGSSVGAANLISGNLSHGLAPLDATNLTIQGNLIGTDWTGKNAIPNQVGLTLGDNLAGSLIGGETDAERNIISGNTLAGILSGARDFRIEGNYVGLDIDGENPLPNGAGMLIGGTNTVIGGSEQARNVVSGNTAFNISLQSVVAPSSGNEVSGNYVGTDKSGNTKQSITNVQGEGIRVAADSSSNIIGGSVGNRVAGNRGSGISVRKTTAISPSASFTPSNNAIIGNEIFDNITGGPIASAQGLGIDIYEATINNVTFPADIQADSYIGLGTNANDASDADSGPNDMINFPIIDEVTQNGFDLSVNLDLDAAGSTNGQYRVDFYANSQADESGYGEGQEFLGYTTLGTGDNQIASINVPAGTDLTGKVLSATTTAINNTTASGYGSTSEFSLAFQDINVIAPAPSENLADTGVSLHKVLFTTGALMLGGLYTYRKKYLIV